MSAEAKEATGIDIWTRGGHLTRACLFSCLRTHISHIMWPTKVKILGYSLMNLRLGQCSSSSSFTLHDIIPQKIDVCFGLLWHVFACSIRHW